MLHFKNLLDCDFAHVESFSSPIENVAVDLEVVVLDDVEGSRKLLDSELFRSGSGVLQVDNFEISENLKQKDGLIKTFPKKLKKLFVTDKDDAVILVLLFQDWHGTVSGIKIHLQ